MQIVSYIVLTFAAAALLEYVFSAPRGSLWLRLTPAIIGLSTCGLFQVAIFWFVGHDRVPRGFFNSRPSAIWWTIVLPAFCLSIATAIFLRRVFEGIERGTRERREAFAWSAVVWLATAAFLATQLARGSAVARL